MDNDDAINKDFIKTIQLHGNDKKCSHILSFVNGYQYHKKSGALLHYYFPTNHFTSYIANDTSKIIYDFLHMDIIAEIYVNYIKKKGGMWLEVVHDSNVYNCMGSIKLSDYIEEYSLEEAFSIKIKNEFTRTKLIKFWLYFLLRKFWIKKNRLPIF